MPLYCHELCAGSLARWALAQRGQECRYLQASPGSLRLARWLRRLRLLPHLPEPFRFHLADLASDTGESRVFAILDAVREACLDAGRAWDADPFVQAFGSSKEPRAFVRFLEKVLSEELFPLFVAIEAVRASEPAPARPLLLIRAGAGARWAHAYGAGRGVDIATYPAFDWGPLPRRAWAALSRRLGAMRSAPGPVGGGDRPAAASDGPGTLPVVAGWYTGQRITFDEKTRSAFFWMLETPIPGRQVLLYFNRRDVPLTEAGAACLTEHGVRLAALDPLADATGRAPLWNPGTGYADEQRRSIRAAALALLRSLAHGSLPSAFCGSNALVFGHHYAYWRDFFGRQGVKVGVSAGDFSKEYPAKTLALRDCGGISVSYQFSNLWAPSLQMNSSSDVMFCFGPAYRPFWEANGSAVRFLVYTGYISDYSFKPNQPDAARLRNRLTAAGAKDIVCFFDENSSDDPLCVISNERAARVYRAFLEKVLSDPSFGLLCKPGYPKTLRTRLGPDTTALIDRARSTGRCVFLEDGAYVTDCYPTLAAQAADVCVGLLLSGTAALEAFLSGTPTVFLDLEKLYSNPIYPAGKGRIVFDSLDSLLARLTSFFADRASVPGFGDLSDWAKDRDPYKDGRAAGRAGSYLGWLYEAFAAGKDREAALAFANGNFRARWGADSIAELRAPGGTP